MSAAAPAPHRLLVVLPSWVGDAVMATPALRALRRGLPGALVGGLVRPGIDELLAGTGLLDDVIVERASGMMGHKRAAAKVRLGRYDTALLFTNSFSTALTTRLAGVPRRMGYDRDGRGLLLTDRVDAPRRRDVEPYRRSNTDPGGWAPVPACEYYFTLARRLLERSGRKAGETGPMELVVSKEESSLASALLGSQDLLAILNPGGNNPAKRWPADRFARVAEHLITQRGMRVILSGSPGERELTAAIAGMASERSRQSIIDLPARAAESGMPMSLGLLKGAIARCALMVTNDTGPRHIAAALDVPTVSLFGPTDHRWTTIPFDKERMVLADPTLPEEEVANDHPERCAIEKIQVDRVIAPIEELLSRLSERRVLNS